MGVEPVVKCCKVCKWCLGGVRGPLGSLFEDLLGELLRDQLKEDVDADFLGKPDPLAFLVPPFHGFP